MISLVQGVVDPVQCSMSKNNLCVCVYVECEVGYIVLVKQRKG